MNFSAALSIAGLLLVGTAHAAAGDVMLAIRQEGLGHSRAAAYATELADGIGARLTGSRNLARANDWALATLRAIGASDAHLEDIGEVGLDWRQDNVWLRMSAPDPMPLLAQAVPWSVASDGPREGQAIAVTIAREADFETYRGRLAGKIVLLGPLREVAPITTPLWRRWSDADVVSGKAAEPQRLYHAQLQARLDRRAAARAFAAKAAAFLSGERPLAIIQPSRDQDGGGTGDIVVDNGDLIGIGEIAHPAATVPALVTGIEGFGRAWRLASAGRTVRMQFDVATTIGDRHAHGYNVVAEIPGTDPRLKSQIVMLGAHLDSWASGTGALDDGAGVAIALEAMRILKTIGARPRRTIRIALFCAEEQGLFGSSAYVGRHFGGSRAARPPRSGTIIAAADLVRKPEYERLSAYYNLDHGAGRIRGIFAGDDPQAAEIFRRWIAPLADLGVRQVFGHRYYPGDQSSFEQIGLPGISVLQDGLDYDTRVHHSNLDTVEHLSPPDLAQAATVTAILVLDTADADRRLPRPPLR